MNTEFDRVCVHYVFIQFPKLKISYHCAAIVLTPKSIFPLISFILYLKIYPRSSVCAHIYMNINVYTYACRYACTCKCKHLSCQHNRRTPLKRYKMNKSKCTSICVPLLGCLCSCECVRLRVLVKHH